MTSAMSWIANQLAAQPMKKPEPAAPTKQATENSEHVKRMQAAIVRYARINDKCAVLEIASSLGVSKTAVNSRLQELLDKGAVTRIARGGKFLYSVAK